VASSSNSELVGNSPRHVGVASAIERLKSLHDGDSAFSEVVSFGAQAVPALRALLLQREPSGLYVVRCRVVEALAALKSFNTLAEFLRLDREIEDPAERLGEEAVISAAARSIAHLREDWVFELLFNLARRRCLAGAVAGLGAFKRPESIPWLVRALAEDEARPTAEGGFAVIRTCGKNSARFGRHPAHRSSAARARNKLAHASQRARAAARYRGGSKRAAAPAAADARRRPPDRGTCLHDVRSRGRGRGPSKRRRSSHSSEASRRLAPTGANR
jgi:hypothetical protein